MSEPAIEDVYADRNRLVLLAATMAREAGYDVGFIADPAEPDWSAVAITPPTGQVSWHVPRSLLVAHPEHRPSAAEWPPTTWDGHDNAEKARRIMAWCGPT